MMKWVVSANMIKLTRVLKERSINIVDTYKISPKYNNYLFKIYYTPIYENITKDNIIVFDVLKHIWEVFEEYYKWRKEALPEKIEWTNLLIKHYNELK